MPERSRARCYRQAQRIRALLQRLIRLLLHPRRSLRRLLPGLRPAHRASSGLALDLLVLLGADLPATQRHLLGQHCPEARCWVLPLETVDLAMVLRQARAFDSTYVLFVANPQRLAPEFLDSLARLVAWNSGFDAWLSGVTPGFWSWDFRGFSLDSEAILLIRRSLLELELQTLRNRRNAARLLIVPSRELFPVGRHLATETVTRTSQAPILPLIEALPLAQPRVHPVPAESRVVAVIPTRDRAELLIQAVEGLRRQRLPVPIELVVVDNGSQQQATQAALESFATGPMSFRCVRDPKPFNFSALCNAGIAASSAAVVLLLNNDVVFSEPHSLAVMLELVQLETVGCVGALLRYPDGRLQHFGVELSGELVQHQLYGQQLKAGNLLLQSRQVSAVTGACMMFKRSLWDELGGLDEQLPVDFNDVDFCLRAQALGFANLVAPAAQAVHLESASRGRQSHPSFANSLTLMKARWGKQVGNDPFALVG